jgi:hypothetical protein
MILDEGDLGHQGQRLDWPDTTSVFEPFTIDVPAEGDFPGGSAPMPETQPMGLGLHLWRIHEARGPVDLSTDEVRQAARYAFGHDRVNEWIDQGVTVEALEVALDEVIAEYGRRSRETKTLAVGARTLLVRALAEELTE